MLNMWIIIRWMYFNWTSSLILNHVSPIGINIIQLYLITIKFTSYYVLAPVFIRMWANPYAKLDVIPSSNPITCSGNWDNFCPICFWGPTFLGRTGFQWHLGIFQVHFLYDFVYSPCQGMEESEKEHGIPLGPCWRWRSQISRSWWVDFMPMSMSPFIYAHKKLLKCVSFQHFSAATRLSLGTNW